MKINIVGAGTVGEATGKGFQRLGHEVKYFNRGDRLESADVIFICVPEGAVSQVVDRLVEEEVHGLKVIRSTVLPGTTDGFRRKGAAYTHVCHNPAFFREAAAEYEFMNPHRVIIGECCQEHGNLLEDLYRPLRAPIIRVDPTTSETIKLAANAYLSTLISFWNELHEICKEIGVNSYVVGKVCALDPRISGYGFSLHAQPYRGRCLPKDILALIQFMTQKGVNPKLLRAVNEVNERMGDLKK